MARAFFSALLELLSVPSPARARFDKLFAAARELPVEAAQHPLDDGLAGRTGSYYSYK